MNYLNLLTFLSLIKIVISVPIYMNCNGEKQIVLSFDDGPDVATEGFLQALDNNNIKGLFFVNGIKMVKYNKYDLIKSMYNNGHVLGTHTYSHPALSGLNDFNKRREFFDNELEVFRKLFNNRPYLVRAPYFDYDEYILNNIYDEFGYIEVDASFESTDWYQPENSSRVVETTMNYINTGASFINLLHENIYSNVYALEEIIPYALSKGYTFVDINTCLGLSSSYQNDNTYGPNLNDGVNTYINN